VSYNRQELLTLRGHLDAHPALMVFALLTFIYFDVLCILRVHPMLPVLLDCPFLITALLYL
jgi:hypothetical protein